MLTNTKLNISRVKYEYVYSISMDSIIINRVYRVQETQQKKYTKLHNTLSSITVTQ